MNEIQKIIKYLAIAFGLFLSISIISSIIFGGLAIIGIGTGIDYITSSENEQGVNFSEEFENIENIKMEISISKLNIKTGDVFKVEGINVTDEFKAQKDGETLLIKDKKINKIFFNNDNYPEITVYIPENINLKEIKLETGVSETFIEKLEADTINLKLGVGNIQIDEITADKAKLEGGAGKVVIKNGDLKDANIETGVGNFEYTGTLEDDSEIDCGIGKTQINLTNNEESYKIKAETGIGGLYINNKQVDDNSVYGKGENEVKLTAGIGRVDINFVEKSKSI